MTKHIKFSFSSQFSKDARGHKLTLDEIQNKGLAIPLPNLVTGEASNFCQNLPSSPDYYNVNHPQIKKFIHKWGENYSNNFRF